MHVDQPQSTDDRLEHRPPPGLRTSPWAVKDRRLAVDEQSPDGISRVFFFFFSFERRVRDKANQSFFHPRVRRKTGRFHLFDAFLETTSGRIGTYHRGLVLRLLPASDRRHRPRRLFAGLSWFALQTIPTSDSS